MTYAILLRLDSADAYPLILREDSKPLPRADGVRYRFIAETDDHGEAVRVADLLRRRHSELPAVKREGDTALRIRGIAEAGDEHRG